MSFSSKILIIIQFFCLGFLLLRLNIPTLGFFIFFQILGIGLSLWSVVVMGIGRFNIQPELKDSSLLIRKGPYKLIRNPMYTGLILFFGVSVYKALNLWNLLIFMLLVLVLLLKIQMEEKYLEERFGDQYLAYKKRTKRLIPYLF